LRLIKKRSQGPADWSGANRERNKIYGVQKKIPRERGEGKGKEPKKGFPKVNTGKVKTKKGGSDFHWKSWSKVKGGGTQEGRG